MATTKRPSADTPSAVVTPPERALPSARLTHVEQSRTMRIGEVAERLGLSMRSIRYYEETGLVTPTARTSGGFRLYSEADVQRLLLVMQMKPLDYTLDQMRQVLDDLGLLSMHRRAGSPGDTRRPGSEVGEDRTGDVAAARERLGRLQTDVEERYASARQRLEIASMFRDHLHAELTAADNRNPPTLLEPGATARQELVSTLPLAPTLAPTSACLPAGGAGSGPRAAPR